MAKRRKKKNYRLRKSVRRTLGALFMMSAIIVAAIPFPDAAATSGVISTGGSGTSVTVDPLDSYAYGVAADKSDYDTAINAGIDLKGPEITDANIQKGVIKSAVTMRYTDENVWQYEEQYKYYLLDSNNQAIETSGATSNNGAVILQYNNDYSVKTIKLSSTINSGSYVKVTDQQFNDYFNTSMEAKKQQLKYNQRSDTAVTEKFAYYFPDKYETFKKNVASYEEYLTASDQNDPKYTIKTEDQVTVTADPTTTDLKSGTEGEFFCDYAIKTISGYESINLFNKNFEMIKVEDPTAESNKIVTRYIAKAKDLENAKNEAGLRIDSNGFLYTSTSSDTYTLRGIAEGAFSGITNAMTLELPESIKYIGDEAFMDSFVTRIDITNVESIGNRAFKSSRLEEAVMSTQTKNIGTEAFSNTLLTTIQLPHSILKIGKGAFANNKYLTNVVFSSNMTTAMEVCDYAFYDCVNLGPQLLGSIELASMGKAAFAVSNGEGSNVCTRFEFPNSITMGEDIGDHVLAGRAKLEYVVMPKLMGRNQETTLKETVFKGCTGLKNVLFPDECKFVKFKNNIFSEITNSEFYVQGPEFSKGSNPAYPRSYTWNCILGVERADGSVPYVPYVFKDSSTGELFYEVSKGDYRYLIDSAGVLQSCKFVNSATDVDLVIPGMVGNIPVTGIAENCFEAGFIEHIKTLTIEDGGNLKKIAQNAFAGATILTKVDIGNSVETIGTEAFRDCDKLKEVILGTGINLIGARAFKGCSSLRTVEFEKPADLTAFTKDKILEDAFQINEDESADANLTFIGAIHPQYGPYAYAMDPESFVNRTMGTRICYKTGDPSRLMVILDNRNNYPTLIDYVQYSDLAKIKAYYTPAAQPTAAGTESRVETNLKDKYENYPDQLTAMENNIIDAVKNVVIPEGIKSIDVKGFIKNTSLQTDDAQYAKVGNSTNVITYLQNGSNIDNKKYSGYAQYGLFNSDYEGAVTIVGTNAGTVGDSIGNDFVESITMYDVCYLPNNDTSITGDVLSENKLSGGAFYDCDNLQTVILGNAMQDVGTLPFLGCHKLNSVACSSLNDAGTAKYVCNNKIFYENLSDGTKRIVECLGSRGNSQDGRVTVDTDTDLSNVSEIAVGAFSDCPDLKVVNFEGNKKLTGIPDKIFLNDPLLRTVELPREFRNIGQKAFANCGAGLGVWIYGREVSMATDAFDDTQGATVYTYKDTAAYNTAVRLLGQENVEIISEGYRVRFFDYDGITELIEVQYVQDGENAIPPEEDPVREGYVFTGWNKSYKNITENTDIIALYDIDPASDSGNGGGSGNGSGSGSGDTNNGNGSGSGSGDTNNGNGNGTGGNYVNGGIDLDGDGIPDVDADGNKLYKLTVTNGEGSGYYPAGKTVTIMAGAASSGATFGHWSCSNDKLIFNDATKPITTLTMVASNVTVIANYAGQYTLEVEYGSGSGSYPAGTKVAISAVEAPQGRRFASWVSKTSGLSIESSTKESTVITMPASNAKVTATYADTGSISSNSTNKPSQNGTSIMITKPGISDKDKASAYVSGSSDNFVVKISESAVAADEVQKALQKKYPDMTRIKYFAMDISLYDAKGENKITDTTGLKVNITIPIPDALKEYAGNNRVGAVVNGELETLNPKFTTIDGVPSISFTATHFSPYTIYVDTGNLTVSDTLDATPKTGDGIHPKWFLSLGLACISIILFTKKDRRYVVKAYH